MTTLSRGYRPSAYLSPMRVLASLFEVVEAETPYGGRSVTYEALGVAWLALGARRRRGKSEPGGSRSIETVSAETRDDPRLAEGRVLRFGGADWTIIAVDGVDGRPGRATVGLERAR